MHQGLSVFTGMESTLLVVNMSCCPSCGQSPCEAAWLLSWRVASGSDKCGAGSDNIRRAAQSSRQISNYNPVSKYHRIEACR